jgi:NTP pyrophosphatase (non-canonical NTP hydrolase)
MNIYERAVEKWGTYLQLDMVLEEMLELGNAIMKYRRGRAEDANVEEEIADVEIMLSQLRCIFNEKMIDTFKEEKLERLRRRLDKP